MREYNHVSKDSLPLMLSKSHSSAQVHKMRALCENVVVRQVMRACWPHESPFNALALFFGLSLQSRSTSATRA